MDSYPVEYRDLKIGDVLNIMIEENISYDDFIKHRKLMLQRYYSGTMQQITHEQRIHIFHNQHEIIQTRSNDIWIVKDEIPLKHVERNKPVTKEQLITIVNLYIKEKEW